MLEKSAVVECAYNLTPEQLCERISKVDALVVRSATKVRPTACCAWMCTTL
jgi:D-3-phosphoglycerate dehydrogenase